MSTDRRWAQWVQRYIVDPMEDSAVSVTIYTGKVDAKLATELGAAILLDKPVIVALAPGVHVPERLIRAADELLEVDLATHHGRESFAARLAEVLEELDQ